MSASPVLFFRKNNANVTFLIKNQAKKQNNGYLCIL